MSLTPTYSCLDVHALVLAGSGPDTVALVKKRAGEPFEGHWALIGGRVNEFEDPRNAAIRLLTTESGLSLKIHDGYHLTLRGQRGRDPRGWILTQPFLWHLPEAIPMSGAVTDVAWVPLAELSELAFDHGAILCEGLGRFWPQFPTASRLLSDSVTGFGVPTNPIAAPIYFGGTFDPWHKGHAAAIQSCGDPTRVIVIPDFNPFKSALQVKCSFARYQHIARAAATVGAVTFPGFCGIETANPTYYWLRQLPKPRALLLGADSFLSLRTWTEAHALLNACHELLVAQRMVSEDKLQKASQSLGKLYPHLRVTFLGHHEHEALSSTVLRASRGVFRASDLL